MEITLEYLDAELAALEDHRRKLTADYDRLQGAFHAIQAVKAKLLEEKDLGEGSPPATEGEVD